jgi:hypothetical protein
VFDRCLSSPGLVQLDLDALAFFEIVDSDAIQCVGAGEGFVTAFRQNKSTAQVS